jgi:hypothetical protein
MMGWKVGYLVGTKILAERNPRLVEEGGGGAEV